MMIVPATLAHADELAPNMTAADAAEVWAMNHWGQGHALYASIRLSLESHAWIVDDRVACIFGFAAPSMLGETAIPWMLTSDAVRLNRYAFLRRYKYEIARMLDVFPVLETMVHARHTVCLRWLKWTGFSIAEPERCGVDNDLFCRVTLRRTQWAQ